MFFFNFQSYLLYALNITYLLTTATNLWNLKNYAAGEETDII